MRTRTATPSRPWRWHTLATAKGLIVKAIMANEANALVKRVHYSGKVVQNSQLHLGVFLQGKLEGAMQFGPSLDKRKLQGLVEGTPWNGFIELNRMAFTDKLPRNSESRALGVALRMLKKHAPHLQWVVTFADACQCGDGTIYRAAGFVLTSCKVNQQLYQLPFADQLDVAGLKAKGWTDAEITWTQTWLEEITPRAHKMTVQEPVEWFVQDKMSLEGAPAAHTMSLEGAPAAHKMSLQGAPAAHKMRLEGGCQPSQALSHIKNIMRRLTRGGTSADTFFRAIGGKPQDGYQLRYLYFLDPTARQRLTVPILPFDEIAKRGAGMYRGKTRAGSIASDATPHQGDKGGATPTPALSRKPESNTESA